MTVIVVNFLVPLTVMFYCYYHVAQSMRRYAARNCTAYLNRDWADQADVTKARSQSLPRNVVGSTALNIHRWKAPPPPPRRPGLLSFPPVFTALRFLLVFVLIWLTTMPICSWDVSVCSDPWTSSCRLRIPVSRSWSCPPPFPPPTTHLSLPS